MKFDKLANLYLESIAGSPESSHNRGMENKEYNVVEELNRFQDFVNWARTNFEKLDTDDQISLANFQASAAEDIWFE